MKLRDYITKFYPIMIDSSLEKFAARLSDDLLDLPAMAARQKIAETGLQFNPMLNEIVKQNSKNFYEFISFHQRDEELKQGENMEYCVRLYQMPDENLERLITKTSKLIYDEPNNYLISEETLKPQMIQELHDVMKSKVEHLKHYVEEHLEDFFFQAAEAPQAELTHILEEGVALELTHILEEGVALNKTEDLFIGAEDHLKKLNINFHHYMQDINEEISPIVTPSLLVFVPPLVFPFSEDLALPMPELPLGEIKITNEETNN